MRSEPGIGDLSTSQFDAHRQGIAHMWKQMDHIYDTEVSRIRKKYHIQSFYGHEGIDIGLFYQGRYVWAQLEWCGDVSDWAYVESLDEYDSELQYRLHDIARECSQLMDAIVTKMHDYCRGLGYEMDWDEHSVSYIGHEVTLESRSFQTDWTCIDLL